jgi:hypothetical protein
MRGRMDGESIVKSRQVVQLRPGPLHRSAPSRAGAETEPLMANFTRHDISPVGASLLSLPAEPRKTPLSRVQLSLMIG